MERKMHRAEPRKKQKDHNEDEIGSKKRRALASSNAYRKIAIMSASKQYGCKKDNDSLSDESSSDNCGTFFDMVIPAPKNFLGSKNPFLIASPKKGFNAYDTSELIALKNAGMLPNVRLTNLTKSAGQTRTVRTIKRRLSTKDITIGPNQEIRRRRTYANKSANVEVINSTTINVPPTEVVPLNTRNIHLSKHQDEQKKDNQQDEEGNDEKRITRSAALKMSSSSLAASTLNDHKDNDSKHNQNFIIRGKRQLADGKTQYLLEWSTSKDDDDDDGASKIIR